MSLIDEHEEEFQRINASLLCFLLNFAKQELLQLLKGFEEIPTPALLIDSLLLAHNSPEVAQLLLRNPDLILGCLEDTVVIAQRELLRIGGEQTGLSLKPTVRVRLKGLPGGVGPAIGQIRFSDVGTLLTVSGTVSRSGSINVLEAVRQFECEKCGHQFTVEAEIEAGATIQLPSTCPSSHAKPCKGSSFRHMTELQKHSDFQEVRLQEKSQNLEVGSMPRSITVVLQDDLVDTCRAGDDVVVTAVVSQQWQSCRPGLRCAVDLNLMANNISVAAAKKATIEVSPESKKMFESFWLEHKEQRLAGRSKLLACFCPQIRGMLAVKLATLIMLIGGMQRVDDSGTKIRGEIHMLIIGDPGTGKSQFLKYAAKLSPRAVVTSGRGSSAAGLTATAVREGQHWALEAGAMVLADGGICCIDEFDGLKGEARTAILESMEQQTVSVTKAGLHTRLNTRTTVFGVANPRGTYDPRESLTTNTSLSSPLLSRFDILLILKDSRLPDRDTLVANHVLNTSSKEDSTLPAPALDWNLETLQQYLSWVKNFNPRMTQDAENILLKYYQVQRQSVSRETSRTTIRMLESLVRIAQAHSRLLARTEVTKQDAVAAVMLVDASMADAALLQFDTLQDQGSEDPEADSTVWETRLLAVLS